MKSLIGLLAVPLLALPPDPLPLLFLPAPDTACLWQARGLDYSLCIAPSFVRLHHGGRTLQWSYEGSKPLNPQPEGPPLTRFSDLRGADPAAWRIAEPAFASIRVPGLYPGIDLVLSGARGRLKADYHVAPGADPSLIRIRYGPGQTPRVGPAGGLVLTTSAGDWTENPPLLYQPGAPPAPVDGSVSVSAEGLVTFVPGVYDPSRPLVIDPVLTFSSTLGGAPATSNSPEALALAPNGDIIVAGFTDDPAYPAVSPQRSFSGGVDALVVRLSPSGSSILQATFLGGNADDRAFAVAADPSGGIYLAGWTTSANFPTLNAWRPALSGHRDAFLVRLAPGGASLTFSTFLGGAGEERATALAASDAGVWVAGETNSADFPVTAALQSSSAGQQDGFLARFTTGGAALSSTYLGGSGNDTPRALALTASGEIYIAGGSDSANLPVPPQAWRPHRGGGQDGFILRLNAAGSAVTAGTWLGGAAGETGNTELAQSLALAPGGDLVVGGSTPSPDFPLHAAWLAAHRGVSMGFVARLRPGLDSAVWSTFIGGSNTDRVEAVAVDSAGRVFAAGRTFSLDLPLLAPLQSAYGGNGDAFLAVLNGDGASQVFGTYLGGQDSDAAVGVAINPSGQAVVAGISASPDFPSVSPLATPSAPGHRFFVSIFSMQFHAPLPESVTPSAAQGEQQSFEFRIRDLDGAANLTTILVLLHSSFTSSGACYVAAEPGPGTLSLASDSGLTWSATTAGTGGSLSNSQCTLRAAGSSIQRSGDLLRLTLDLAFAQSFAGQRTIYVLATDQQQMSSSWLQLGSYTVSPPQTGAPPVLSSLLPPSASGLRQTFSLTVTDPQGGADVSEAQILIAPSLTLAQACRVRFTPATSQIHLGSDNGSSWSSATLGVAGTLQNSQCRVHAVSSGRSASGSAAVFWADLEFLATSPGSRRIWGSATDLAQHSVTWTELAAYTVSATPNSAPVVTSATLPGPGGGIFTIAAADSDGGTTIRAVHLLIGDPPAETSACLLAVDVARNTIALHPGVSGAAWPSVTPGQTGLAENSRCRLRGESSSFAVSGEAATFQIQVELKTGFAGPRTVRAHVIDAAGDLSAPYLAVGRLAAQ